MDKESFVFHVSFLEGLPEEDVSMWCYHIVQYGLFGKEPDFDNPYMKTVWIKIRNFMDTNKTKWEKRKEANRLWYEENKGKVKQSKNNSEKLSNVKQDSESSENSENLPYTHGVSESVNESVSVSVSDYVSESVSDIERGEQSSPAPSSKRFSKPTLEEIQGYITEKGYTFSADAFYNFYESNGWKVGKNSMKNWKAACKTWQEREPKQETAFESPSSVDYNSPEWQQEEW